MKRLALLVVIITLPLITFFQYKKHKRFEAPSTYDYILNDSIDYNYYDPLIVQQYLENVYKIGSFARNKWFNERIDVRFTNDSNPESIQATQLYNQMIVSTRYMEGRLIYSSRLKEQGFDNSEIKRIIEDGLSPDNFELVVNDDFMNLGPGSLGHLVWEIQGILIKKGYEIPHDGVFGFETENALKSFQTDAGIYSSGIVDKKTLKELLKNS